LQIVELVTVGHDEVSRPELVYFFVGKWDSHDSEGTENVLETTKPGQDLRCCDWYRHDRWQLQPGRRLMRKTELSRKAKMPRLKDPRWQGFLPFLSCPPLPVRNAVRRS